MKIIFFGTPDYVLPVLEAVHKKFRDTRGRSGIVAVVTQRPQPVGRKQILTYSAVDAWAFKRNISIFYSPANLLIDKVEADLGIVASYGEILRKEVINHFPLGLLNIHFSTLPKFRGASPVQAAILTGEKEIGVSIIKLDEKLDHGPILTQFTEEISKNETTGELRKRLFIKSADVLAELLPAYISGKVKPHTQDHEKATYTTTISKQDGFILPKYLDATLKGDTFKGMWKIEFIKDYCLVPSANSLKRFIRAMQPWPGAWTKIAIGDKQKEIRRLKILEAKIDTSLIPYRLSLITVQLEGKNPVSWKQFKEAYPTVKFSEE